MKIDAISNNKKGRNSELGSYIGTKCPQLKMKTKSTKWSINFIV